MYSGVICYVVVCLFVLIFGAPVIKKPSESLHEPLHEPGSLDQLLEAWEEEDGMNPENFDARLFFLMHDLDGNKELSPEEVDVILEREMEKLNGNETHTNKTYVAHVVKEMRDYFMQQYDRNRDGKISMDEFLNNPHHSPGQHSEEWVPQEDKWLDEEIHRQEELAARQRALREAHHGNSQNDHFQQPSNDKLSVEQRQMNFPVKHDPQRTVLASNQPRSNHVGLPEDQNGHHEAYPGIQAGQQPGYQGGGHFPHPGSFDSQPPAGHPGMHPGFDQVGQHAGFQVGGQAAGTFGSHQPPLMRPGFQPPPTGQNTEGHQPQHPGLQSHPGVSSEHVAQQSIHPEASSVHVRSGEQFASNPNQPGVQQELHPGQNVMNADTFNSQDHVSGQTTRIVS